MQNLLLSSPNIAGHSRCRRYPLVKVVLPAEFSDSHNYVPVGNIWWIEGQGENFSLRAKLHVEGVALERELLSGNNQLVWYLSPIRSERVTCPGSKHNKESNVTKLLRSFKVQVRGGFTLAPIPDDLDRQLDECRLNVSANLWRFDIAARTIRPRIDQAKAKWEIPAFNLSTLSFEQALHLIRAYFARDELVRIQDYDAFQVAAAILMGYQKMPNEFVACEERPKSLTCTQNDDFQELDDENLAFNEYMHIKQTFQHSLEEPLDLCTKHHQEILQVLARQVRLRGLSPTYNRFVDLRVERQYDEIFFEVKTTDEGNFGDQVRRAVSQLLEYRFRYKGQTGGKPIRLAAVLEANASYQLYQFTRDFLADLDIMMVLWDPKTQHFHGLDQALQP